MKIAHLTPYSISYPLKSHNGRYEWVQQLAQLQAKQGHEVTIYGGPGSEVEGVVTRSIDKTEIDRHQNNTAIFELAFTQDYDIYHSHFDTLHYEVAEKTTRPIIFTQHWWPSKLAISYAQDNSPRNLWAVPPTKYMFEFDKKHGIASKGSIYHGIDLTKFQPADTLKSCRLLFVGRLSPEKNLAMAIDFANQSNIGLDIVGKSSSKYQSYWESLLPLIDGQRIRYLGPLDHPSLIQLYTSATALLFPSYAEEAFGLVAIESQACGTPVIMQRGGSRAELIDEGRTGFLCTTDEEFISAIKNASSLDLADCRVFAEKFNIQTMTSQYEQLYYQLTS